MNLQKSLRSVGVRTWLKLTGVLALIGGLAIFTGAEEGSPAQEQKYTFYMVVDRSIAYPEAWTDLLRGVREVDEVHADLDVIYLETGDYRECLALVEKVIWLDHPKPDGLIIATAPYEYHPLSPLLDLLDLAIKKGIHVTMIGLIPPYYLQKRFFEINWIGEDSYQAGMMAAEELQKRFTPSTVFVVVSPQRGDWGRLAGFQRVIEKPVESFIVNPTDVTSIDPLLFKLREEIEPVVFIATPDHRFTERFIQLAKELEIKLGPGGVRLVQAGAPFEKVLIYILDKIIVAAIDQQWYLQGHLAMEGMYSYVKYGIRRPFVTTQEIVTEETIRTPIVLEAEPQNQLIPWGDPLGLLLAEAKGKPIRVISNPCSCRPNPPFEISNPVEKNKLAEFFKDLPRTDPPAQVLCGGFVIFNPAIDPRIPGYAHVARGLIQMPKLIGGKTEYVYYKDIHGLEKWLEELYKRLALNQRVIETLLVAMKRWRIRLRPDIPSGPFVGPSLWISDPAKVDELAKFFEDLPAITEPAQWAGGGFMLFPEDYRRPWMVSVASGVIEVRVVPEVIKDPKCTMFGEEERAYYKDIHELERWLEELYQQLDIMAELKKRFIQVGLNRSSGLPNPSFEISDPAEIDKLAEFFKDLPRTDPPAQVLYGGFVIFNPAIDPRIPGYAHVARGLIQMPKLIGGKTEYVYYKDIHGLEKWLEELYKQEFINCNQSSAPLDAESTLSQHEPESTSLLAQQQQLPTSGAEPPYEPQRWNIPVATPPEYEKYTRGEATIDDRWKIANYLTLKMIQGENNCYNYADNIVTDTFAQPGRLAGKPLPLQSFVMDGKGDLADSEEKILKELCNRIGKAAEADGSRPPRQPGLKPWDCASKCEPGYYKEALFTGSMDPPRGADLDKDNSPDKKWFDYHWYRQDKGGNWSHKQGRTPVTNLDSDKKAITDPRVAKRKYDYDYKQFCGCFCRGPNMAKQ